MKVALIMAIPDESKGLFEQAGIRVHYSGIGKINAAFSAFDVIQKTGCDVLLNLGSAGSATFDAHTLVEVSQLVQRDMDVSPLGFAIGTTPLDQDFPAAITLEHFFQNCHAACVEQVILLKRVHPSSPVIWWIWKRMRSPRCVKN